MMIKNWSGVATPSGTTPAYANEIATVLSAHCCWKAISTATKSVKVQRDSDWAEKDYAFADGWADATDSWGSGSTLYVTGVYDQVGNYDAAPTSFAPVFTSVNDHGLVQLDVSKYNPLTSAWWARTTTFICGFIVERPTTVVDNTYGTIISLDADAWYFTYGATANKWAAHDSPNATTKGSGFQVVVLRSGVGQKITVSNNDLSDVTASGFSDDTFTIATGVTRIGRLSWGGEVTAKFAGAVFLDSTSDAVYDALLTYLKTKLADLQ